MKTVGVLGGMGPAATLDFLTKLHAATPATRDEDHLRVISDSDPRVPGRNAALSGAGPSPGPALAAMARRLETAGAELLAMPCNAAHGWADEIAAAVSIPFVSMIEAAADAAAATGVRKIGVLAAAATLQSGLYHRSLAARGVTVVAAPAEAIMPLIMRVKAGDTGAAVRDGIAALAAALAGQSAGAVLMACTEVPLVLSHADVAVPLVDATAALVDAVLARALVRTAIAT